MVVSMNKKVIYTTKANSLTGSIGNKHGDVLVGDKLITSGYGGIYPKGLPVGNVQSIENDTEGFVKNAVITPSVDFYRLEEVFVLTSSSVSAPQKPGLEPKLVPQTQRDQVEGAKGAVKP